jgi:hypothetical protein
MRKVAQNNKFNFFVETELHKSKNEYGEDVVIIDGIASTSTVADSDSETLYPIGFNLEPFLTHGMVNFNHQGSKDANANIGIPLEAKIINNGKDLYVKCMLWDCPQTQGIVRAYENFKKYSPDRKIGYSIEGRATQRDMMDNKRILKADIHGLAVTFSPKNKNTLMNIVKGEYEKPFIDIENDEEEETEKAITTESIAPTSPESVETKKRVEKSSNFDKLITKSNIYLSIAKQYPTASIAETKSIYTLIQEVNTKMFKMENNQKVYPEAIQKAFDLIANATNLIKGETTEAIVTTDNIIKSEEADEEEVEKALPFAEMLSKAGFDKDKACDTMCKGGIALTVAQGAWEKVISAANAAKDGDKEPEQVTAPIVKSEDIQPLVNIQDEIKKSLEPFAGTLSGIGEAIKQGFAGYNDLIKSMQDTNNTLVQRIEQLERTPQPVKSITANNAIVADRFAKGQDATQLPVGTEAYNVNNREDLKKLSQRIMDELEVNFIQKGKDVDPLLEGTINHIEVGGVVPEFAYSRLRAMGIILQKG